MIPWIPKSPGSLLSFYLLESFPVWFINNIWGLYLGLLSRKKREKYVYFIFPKVIAGISFMIKHLLVSYLFIKTWGHEFPLTGVILSHFFFWAIWPKKPHMTEARMGWFLHPQLTSGRKSLNFIQSHIIIMYFVSDNIEFFSKTNKGPYNISIPPAMVYVYCLSWQFSAGWEDEGSRRGGYALLPWSHLATSRDTSRRRQWHPTPVLLPGNPRDGGAW